MSKRKNNFKFKQGHLLIGIIVFILFAFSINNWVDYLLSNNAVNNQKNEVMQAVAPTNSPTPEAKNNDAITVKNTPTPNPNPIVNCKAPPGSKCFGQGLKVSRSVCLSRTITCCPISGNWYLIYSKDCKNVNNNPLNIPSNLFFPTPTIDTSFQDFVNSMRVKFAALDLEYQNISELIKNTTPSYATINSPQGKMLYDLCVGLVNDKYSNKSGQIIGQSGSVAGGVYYGTENKDYQNDLGGCSVLLK